MKLTRLLYGSSNMATSGTSHQTLLIAEINDHLSAIRTLKFQYNALAPIYMLPMEILVKIFLEYSSGFVAITIAALSQLCHTSTYSTIFVLYLLQ